MQAYDGPIYIADAALFVKATQPQLGIEDPYQLTETQYNAVLKVLRDQQPLIHRYWHDATVQMNDFKNEGVAASSSWPYQANGLKAEGQPVATVFPKEGVTGWADTTMLHSEAKHPVCAYKWMNWSLTPKVQGDVAAGSVRCRWCLRAVKPARCSVIKAVRPTAMSSLTAFTSGKRRLRKAGNTCPIAAGLRTILR